MSARPDQGGSSANQDANTRTRKSADGTDAVRAPSPAEWSRGRFSSM
jgi:hypothetical protein